MTLIYICVHHRGVNETFVPTWPQIQMHPKFDAHKPTYFITHGYSSGINTEWFHNLTNAILNKVSIIQNNFHDT